MGADGNMRHSPQRQFAAFPRLQGGNGHGKSRLRRVQIGCRHDLPLPAHVEQLQPARAEPLRIARIVQLLRSGRAGFLGLVGVKPGAQQQGIQRIAGIVAISQGLGDGKGAVLRVEAQGELIIVASCCRRLQPLGGRGRFRRSAMPQQQNGRNQQQTARSSRQGHLPAPGRWHYTPPLPHFPAPFRISFRFSCRAMRGLSHYNITAAHFLP